jgi:dipeptidyl aminopeptidase/acylaminoacyl peptidase
MPRRLLVLAIAAALLSVTGARTANRPPFSKQRVTFKSGSLTLVGFLFRPEGPGPFPAVLWNHGSEPNPGGGPQFDSVAAIFVPAGYTVFAPVRRGHGESEGTYIQDELARTRATRGPDAAEHEMVHLMETEQLDDQLAGLAYVKGLPFVDTTRLVVAGCSYGGIETLLGAERGAGYKAAVSISPAALSWQGHAFLQDRLVRAVRKIDIPVMLIQPPKDASLEPSRVLGAEFKRLGKRFTGKIYPAEGPEDQQVHCFGGAKGMHVWATDVLAFLAGVFRQ